MVNSNAKSIYGIRGLFLFTGLFINILYKGLEQDMNSEKNIKGNIILLANVKEITENTSKSPKEKHLTKVRNPETATPIIIHPTLYKVKFPENIRSITNRIPIIPITNEQREYTSVLSLSIYPAIMVKSIRIKNANNSMLYLNLIYNITANMACIITSNRM